jgi:hypothetical protein
LWHDQYISRINIYLCKSKPITITVVGLTSPRGEMYQIHVHRYDIKSDSDKPWTCMKRFLIFMKRTDDYLVIIFKLFRQLYCFYSAYWGRHAVHLHRNNKIPIQPIAMILLKYWCKWLERFLFTRSLYILYICMINLSMANI